METKKLKILTDVLGTYHRSKYEYLYKCPYCNHHKRKLSVNILKNVYKCWVCDTKGRSLQRIVRRFGTFHQKQEWSSFEETTDISLFDELFGNLTKIETEQVINVPENFTSLVNKNLPNTASPALRYLSNRNITKDDIARWKIGYCFSGDYAGRVLIPSFNLNGKINYFIARSYGSEYPKYKNPPINRDIVFNHLYIDWTSDLVLVEGAFDAIVAGPNSIPLLGSTLREDSKLFKEIVQNDTPIYIALDPDAEKKAMRLVEKMLTYDIELYKIDIKPYADVGEMTKEEFSIRKQNATLMTFDTCLKRKATMIKL